MGLQECSSIEVEGEPFIKRQDGLFSKGTEIIFKNLNNIFQKLKLFYKHKTAINFFNYHVNLCSLFTTIFFSFNNSITIIIEHLSFFFQINFKSKQEIEAFRYYKSRLSIFNLGGKIEYYFK